MPFWLIRLLDQTFGRIALMLLAPLGGLVSMVLGPPLPGRQKTFSFLKLHGGGSLLIALPALLGIRKKHPDALFVLICTGETRQYAELTGIFNDYYLIDQSNLLTLVKTGFRTLFQCFRHDVFVDMEPHSFLAAVFTLLTFAVRRLGFVKSNEIYRARAYTDALFFNPFAPIYEFYDQMAGFLNATPAATDACSACFPGANQAPAQTASNVKTIYLSPFCSEFAKERMMPNDLWPRLLKKQYGDAPLIILLGGGAGDANASQSLAAVLKQNLATAEILNLCGTRTLQQSVEDIRVADAFWGIDSGPLHIARWLGKPCRSFWGPTNPLHRLRRIDGLDETTSYLSFACSPCIDSVEQAPCRGNNLCMKLLLEPPAVTPPVVIRSTH